MKETMQRTVGLMNGHTVRDVGSAKRCGIACPWVGRDMWHFPEGEALAGDAFNLWCPVSHQLDIPSYPLA